MIYMYISNLGVAGLRHGDGLPEELDEEVPSSSSSALCNHLLLTRSKQTHAPGLLLSSLLLLLQAKAERSS